MAVLYGGGKLTLTASYQTVFHADTPWGSGANGPPLRSAIVRGVGNGIVVQVTTKNGTGATADTREQYGADGQDVICTCNDLAFERITRIEIKGESAAGVAYYNAFIRDGG